MDDFCSALVVLTSHVMISPIVIILAVFHLKKIVLCVNMTATLLLQNRYSRRLPIGTFAVLVSAISLVIKIIASLSFHKRKYPFVYYTFYISYACPILIVHLINIMCLVSQNSHEDINREMEEICILKSQSERAFRLTSLMNDHWFLEDYIEHISDTFGFELLFILLDIYIQLLLSVYVFVWDYIVRSTNQDVYSVVSLSLRICIGAGNLFYLCYRCNATVKESRRVIAKLQHLRNVLYDDSICQALLKVFTLQVNCREVHLTVLKLFNINLSLLFCSAGVMFTYFLVLIQFQIDGYREIIKEENISDHVITGCKSWPCINKQ